MESGIILCVDDDSTVLNALRSVLSSHFGKFEFHFRAEMTRQHASQRIQDRGVVIHAQDDAAFQRSPSSAEPLPRVEQ